MSFFKSDMLGAHRCHGHSGLVQRSKSVGCSWSFHQQLVVIES
jgi:hypothetical protein